MNTISSIRLTRRGQGSTPMLRLNCLILIICTGQVLLNITNPLAGDVGTNLLIVCGALSTTHNTYFNPSTITIKRNGDVYFDDRLRSSTNETHKTYTLLDLRRTDSGAMIQCAISEEESDSVPIEVYCELILKVLMFVL